jgi:hypothetical protein
MNTDIKTNLAVWVLENTCTEVKFQRYAVGDDEQRVQVTFIDESGQCGFVVDDWWKRMREQRSDYDTGCPIEFSPSCDGLFRTRDSRAMRIVENRKNRADLLERRDELKKELFEIQRELGEEE